MSSTNSKILITVLGLVAAVVLIASTAGCAAVYGDDWTAARASGEQARAAAEWAHTSQVQAESAAAAREAPTRAAAQTAGIVALLLVGVLTAAGLGAALVVWSWRRAHLVFADKSGLYPVVVGSVAATNLNEPGAQHARIAPGRVPYQVLPAPEAVPAVPAPIVLDARQLEHIERLLLPAGSVDHDTD